MLIEFKFSNYRSFRDETVLSMEASGFNPLKKCLIKYHSNHKRTNNPLKIIPVAAIYGKNGGGKSNVIRAFWLAVQFIKNAQRTQHEKASIPVNSFLLNDSSASLPTSFDFTYVYNDIKYNYGFSATKNVVVEEHLYHWPKGQRALVFTRDYQNFHFVTNNLKIRRELIAEAVAPNQLYFAIACTMNEQICINAMTWFRDCIYFSRDYADFPGQLLEYSNNPQMLKSISEYAKVADVGIEDMRFEIYDKELSVENVPDNLPDGIKIALIQFIKSLSDVSTDAEQKLRLGEVRATAFHKGINTDGSEAIYTLQLPDESDGTRRLMSLAPDIEKALACGGVLLVDELEKEIHPILVEYIVSKFQNPTSNPNHAQLIFTTHDTELLDMELLRKDQLYFVDKDRYTGSSSFYSISGAGSPTGENMRKSYLIGKYGAIPELDIEEVE